MSNIKKDIITKFYPKFKFIEEDISKFSEIACFNNVKDIHDIEKNIYKYIANKITEKGFINIFEDALKVLEIKNTFDILNSVIKNTNIDINDNDIQILCNIEECQNFYNEIITKTYEEDTDGLDISNKLLKKVIEEKLLFLEDTELESMTLDDDTISDNIVKDYLKQIGGFKVLSRDEEKELFERYNNGDEEAFEKIVNHNLKLVVAIAKKKKPQNLRMGFMDYIQEGNIGLMKAVTKFESTRGTRFSTYATWWIRQSLGRAIDNNTTIGIPVYMNENIRKYYKAKCKLESETSNIITDEDIRKEMKIDEATYKKIKNAVALMEPVSLNQTIDNGGKRDRETSIGNLIADENIESVEDEVERNILHEQEEKIMDKVLNDREKKVLKLRLGFDTGQKVTLEQIGKEFGITREAIRKIESNAYRKLNIYGKRIKQEELKRKALKEYIRRKENNNMERKLENIIKNKESNQKKKTGPAKKTIYELVGASSDAIDKTMYNILNTDELKIVRLRENIISGNSEDVLSEEENRKFYQVIRKIKKALGIIDSEILPTKEESEVIIESHKDNNLAKSYKELLAIALKDPRVIQEIDIRDIAITCVRYGIGKSKEPRDIKTISKFYQISEKEIEKISNAVLQRLYEIILEDIKINTTKQLIKTKED